MVGTEQAEVPFRRLVPVVGMVQEAARREPNARCSQIAQHFRVISRDRHDVPKR